MACCACGGGKPNSKLRFGIGELIKHVGFYKSCIFKIIEIEPTLTQLHKSGRPFYKVELTNDCGRQYMTMLADGDIGYESEHEKGLKALIFEDERTVMTSAVNRYDKIELRKCKVDVMEQEFVFLEQDDNKNVGKDGIGDTNKRKVIIHHVPSNTNVTVTNTKGTIKNKNASMVILQKSFSEQNVDLHNETFLNSQNYFHILSDETNELYANGEFGEADYEKPRFNVGGSDPMQSAVHIWLLQNVENAENDGNIIDDNNNKTLGNNDNIIPSGGWEEHANWLKTTSERRHGLRVLGQMAPWQLLDVDRYADPKEVKAMFRALSRKFHPDKQQTTGIIRENMTKEVFVLLQQAYDGLKNSNEEQREDFRIKAETEQQLFARSKYVKELVPSDWRRIQIGNGLKYVIATSMADRDDRHNATADDSSNGPGDEYEEVIVDDDFLPDDLTNQNNAQLWLLYLYSPRCGMSRAAVSFVELAAAHLLQQPAAGGTTIRVGAYGCGIHGESLKISKEEGFRAWNKDPICKQFGRQETPNTHVVVEAINGTRTFHTRAAMFQSFHHPASCGSTRELWPKRLINFASDAELNWIGSALVERLTEVIMNSSDFVSSARVVAFVDEGELEDLGGVQGAVVEALPAVARQLVPGGVRVGVAPCAAIGDAEEDAGVDCSKHGVSFLPDVRIFGVNTTVGLSLIGEKFVERRDAQIGRAYSS